MMANAFKRIARAIRKRPILAIRYRMSTAMFRGKESDSPEWVTAHKGVKRIDFLAIAAALASAWLFLKGVTLCLKRKKRKK